MSEGAAINTTTNANTKAEHHHHDLFSWLKYIKEHHHYHHHHHDRKSICSSEAANSQQQQQDQPHLYTIPSQQDSNDTIHSGTTSNSENDHKRSSFSTSAIHFHRPYSLLEKIHSHSHQSRKLSSILTTNNDVVTADDETQHKYPYLVDKVVDSSTSINSFLSSSSRGGGASIPSSELDSPGYKKLMEDGNLVDYDDDMSMFDGDEEMEIQIAHARSVMRNDLIRLALNGPFQCPLVSEDHHQKKQVLHVGCGNGNWGVDMASLFPHWLILGMDDKSGGPVQDERKVPRNFKYIRCYHDLLTTLHDVPDESFDLVFARFLIFSYGEDDYKELIRQCERVCKPGGYVEFYELDLKIYGNPRVGPMTQKLNAKVFRVMESQDLDPRLARKLGDMVSDIFHTHGDRLKDCEDKKLFETNYTSLPLGVWGGRLGVLFRDDINDLYEYLNINQVELYSDDIRQEDTHLPTYDEPFYYYKEMEIQKAFMNLHHVYARKCTLCSHDEEQF